MTEAVVVYEKSQFGVAFTHLCGFAESPRFHLYSFQGPSVW